MPFGQLVIGPPGSGKSTYVNGMSQFLNAIGRKATCINLDCANDKLSYDARIDIRDFITLEEVMETEGLGPNGSMLHAMDSLYAQVDDFIYQIKRLGSKEYFLFDCPGQVELFTHHPALRNVFSKLEKELDFRLCVVNLMDCFYLTSANQYVSVVLLALRTMLQFNLPQVNVFSKIDLLRGYGPLDFKLDFYTEVENLDMLAEDEGKLSKLTASLSEVITDFGLVRFEVLSVENKRCMIQLLNVIDKANGYLFGSTEIGGDSVWIEASRQNPNLDIDLNERWIENKQYWDDKEAEEDLVNAAKSSEMDPNDPMAMDAMAMDSMDQM